ncbi:MAG: hypothetical protein ACLUTA_05135 [Blautia wexlerae]
MSGAEQHFLGYKSIAAIEAGIQEDDPRKAPRSWMWAVETLQASLFDKDALVTTQDLGWVVCGFAPASAGTGERQPHHYDQSGMRNLSEMSLLSYSSDLYLKDTRDSGM